jgi:NADH-quinone oxidoreductase subunit M
MSMFDIPLLSSIIFLPLIGAAFIFALIRGKDEVKATNAKTMALWTSIVTFLLSLTLLLSFNKNTAAFQFVEVIPWVEGYNINYHLGIDGISLFFILLTTFLTPICILASWKSITNRVSEYMIAFLLLETLVIGVFCALDFVLFYLFFEAMLLPMFLIIGIWGGDRKVYAAFKFFLYTLAGSVFLLLAILYIYHNTHTMNIPTLMKLVPQFSPQVQWWLFVAFLVSFAVKVPMWPVHTWLPDAHVQAPTAGSVILAGILLKMGAYGFLRFSLPMLPHASQAFVPVMFGLSVAAVIYASLVALMQQDMKKLIAYSSVAHMGFVTIGIFTFNVQGVEGAIIQMISHGLVAGALFLCVGVVYDRMHTREIAHFGGLAKRMPVYASIFMFFTMASIGLPGTSGFVGEFLTLAGVYQVNQLFAALAATGVVLGAAYMLWLYARVVFGEITHRDVQKIEDMDAREVAYFVPIIALVLLLGIYPSVVTNILHVPVENLLKQVRTYSQTASAQPNTAKDLRD